MYAKILVFSSFITLSALGFSSDFTETKTLAEKGHAGAQFDLGTMYDLGEGVAKNYKEAAVWYRKAAEQGEVAAQYNLAIMYDTGEGVNKDIVQAYAWMSAAEMFGYQGAKESSRDFLVRMSPKQKEQAEKLTIEIVNKITDKSQE